jgi:hypothetical protein
MAMPQSGTMASTNSRMKTRGKDMIDPFGTAIRDTPALGLLPSSHGFILAKLPACRVFAICALKRGAVFYAQYMPILRTTSAFSGFTTYS